MDKAAERLLMNLNGAWEMYYAPEKGGKNQDYVPGMESVWEKAIAEVPCNSELVLEKSGVVEEAFYDLNSLELAKYEYYQWLYVKRFSAELPAAGERAVMVFDGIDTVADVYLNGKHLAHHDGGYSTWRVDMTEAMQNDIISRAEHRM